jgi:TIR domain
MPVFISYSHQDRDFVDKLAAQLVRNRVHLWLDRWELRVGDSLTSCIESAIGGASALLIVLSRAAVKSDWCRRELNAGLVRELEERRVVVLPVLIEDCQVPLFLRDKLYADFRSSPDHGLQAVLDSLTRFTNDSLGRIVEPEWHMDWAMDWGTIEFDGEVVAAKTRVTIVEQAVAQPYSVLSMIDISWLSMTVRVS